MDATVENDTNWQFLVDNIPLGKLTNTDKDTFWYKTRAFHERYKHEEAKRGQTFIDGNNGDRWVVVAANTQYKRLVVENKTQGGKMLVYYD